MTSDQPDGSGEGRLRVGLLTREYPPFVYGGAGVHVEFLTRELRHLGIDVDVQCLGADRPEATAHAETDPRLPTGSNAVLGILSADVAMAAAVADVDVVHSHTWYANMAGHWSKLLYGIPHVVTAHSLEPLRPWKAEQLGGGYHVSSWAERTALYGAEAVIAVSRAMRHDILTSYPDIDPERISVISNGIDTELYQPSDDTDVLERIGVDLDRPYVAFVGRVTRQKGVAHLLRAATMLDDDIQLVMLAGAADTPELERETSGALTALTSARGGVFWVAEMMPPAAVRQVLSHAIVFCCPSVYEPQGIVNLEAMACETAVVASDVGGIPDIVDEGATGTLVHYDAADPTAFERELASALNDLTSDPRRAADMGRAGRERAVGTFGWDVTARHTADLYRSLT